MSAALILLVYAIALLVSGWWLASLSGGFNWGMGVMAVGLIVAIRGLFAFMTHSFHASQQISLLHESRTLSHKYGHARLACETDDFVKALSNNPQGFFIGILGKSPLFYDPFASGNGAMLTYAPSRTGKTISIVITAALHWFGGSIFIPDIKGEVTAICMLHRQKNGHHVISWNPFGVLGIPSLSFNPLYVLVQDVLTNKGRNLHDLALLIASQLLPKASEKESGAFFRNGGRKLLIIVV